MRRLALGLPFLACLILAEVFSLLLYICAVWSSVFPVTSIPAMLSGGCSHGTSCCHLRTPGSKPHGALSRDCRPSRDLCASRQLTLYRRLSDWGLEDTPEVNCLT